MAGPFEDERKARNEWIRLTYCPDVSATTRYSIAAEAAVSEAGFGRTARRALQRRHGPLRRDPDARRRWPSSPGSTAASTAAARRCSPRAPSGRRRSTPARCPISCAETAAHPRRRLDGRADPGRPDGPAGRDHRADRPQDGDQRAQFGRAGVHGRFRGRDLADLGQSGRGPGQSATIIGAATSPIDDPATGKHYALGDKPAVLMVRPRGWHLDERHRRRRPAQPVRFRPLSLAQRPCRDRRRLGPLFLSAQARKPSRGGAVERRLRLCRGAARPRARHDQGDGADRDDPRRVRDGRDPPRAQGEYRRPQLRPLGLYLLDHQAARPHARAADPGPVGDDHG